jgi:hypothetical protein
MVVGSRAQVWNGSADKTSGGLMKEDLVHSKGRIRSKKAVAAAKKKFAARSEEFKALFASKTYKRK